MLSAKSRNNLTSLATTLYITPDWDLTSVADAYTIRVKKRNIPMKKITYTLLALAMATAGWCADPPGEAPKPKTPAEVAYEKALEANVKDAEKAYAQYQEALGKATAKVLKSLEAAKAELNDPRKGKLSITERAAAIAEIDKKIEEVKKGSIGEVIVKRQEAAGDLLGETPKEGANTKKLPLALINTKWAWNSNILNISKTTVDVSGQATTVDICGEDYVVFSVGRWSYEIKQASAGKSIVTKFTLNPDGTRNVGSSVEVNQIK